LKNFDLTNGLHPSVSSLTKYFCFHQSLIEAFLICPNLIEAVVPYPNAPILLKCLSFYPKRYLSFLVGSNSMEAVGITT